MPMSTILTYQNIEYLLSHVNSESPAFATFSRFTCPQIIPHKLACGHIWRALHICALGAPTIPAPIALKLTQEANVITSFLDMQTEIVLFCSRNMVFISFCVHGLLSDMPNFTIYALPRHSSVHRLCHILLFDLGLGISINAICCQRGLHHAHSQRGLLINSCKAVKINLKRSVASKGYRLWLAGPAILYKSQHYLAVNNCTYP
jgi:hypothetical protein